MKKEIIHINEDIIDMINLISELLKDQREICAQEYFKNPKIMPDIMFEDSMNIIRNSSEPELWKEKFGNKFWKM